MRIRVFYLILFVLISNCFRNSFFLSQIDKENAVVAVLPFYGSHIPSSITQLATNELIRLIFIDHKIAVSEPIQINYYLRKKWWSDLSSISAAQLCALADSLGATHFVIGLIESSFTPNLEENRLQRVTVTLRFIESEQAKIVGMTSKKICTSQPLDQVIPLLLKDMLEIK